MKGFHKDVIKICPQGASSFLDLAGVSGLMHYGYNQRKVERLLDMGDTA
jgi:hypothetical protein